MCGMIDAGAASEAEASKFRETATTSFKWKASPDVARIAVEIKREVLDFVISLNPVFPLRFIHRTFVKVHTLIY